MVLDSMLCDSEVNQPFRNSCTDYQSLCLNFVATENETFIDLISQKSSLCG